MIKKKKRKKKIKKKKKEDKKDKNLLVHPLVLRLNDNLIVFLRAGAQQENRKEENDSSCQFLTLHSKLFTYSHILPPF